jgi:hypothetical protein
VLLDFTAIKVWLVLAVLVYKDIILWMESSAEIAREVHFQVSHQISVMTVKEENILLGVL